MATPSADVDASLLYFNPPMDNSKPFQHVNCEMPENFTRIPHQLLIKNIRGREGSVSLDTQGFQFIHSPSAFTSFESDKEIERVYYPESIALLKNMTGASHVVIFDHSKYNRASPKTFVTYFCEAIRRNIPGQPDTPQTRSPVSLVHVDQSPASAAARVHRHLAGSEAQERLQRRWQLVNLWRPIYHTVYDWPLALCDFQSVDVHSDLVAMDLFYPDRKVETLAVKFNPAHDWMYLHAMTPEEAVIFKWQVVSQWTVYHSNIFDVNSYDSKGGVATVAPHTAFQNLDCPVDVPKRQSIELRALVFYD